MNQLLLKHKPTDIEADKFKEMWENSTYTLEPLFKAIQALTPDSRISKDDFEKPAFVEKMVWAQAQRDLADKILDLFPERLKNS